MDDKFRILIVQEDLTLRDCGEGPWDTYEEAEQFKSAEVGAYSVIAGGKSPNLSLRKVKVFKRRSRETVCFEAQLFSGDRKVADVENDGQGGCNLYLWENHEDRKLVEAWAAAQPTEYPVDKLDQIVCNLPQS
jgi:hypothetical protein